jgi:hypothetical protein
MGPNLVLILHLLSLGAASVLNPGYQSKRDERERVFLANCSRGWNSAPSYSTLRMAWYANDDDSHAGKRPDAEIVIEGSWGKDPNRPLGKWEGRQISGTFDDGNTFVSNIKSGADTLADFNYAGSGYNAFHGFNCFKDNGRQLWLSRDPQGGGGEGCWSSYYCEPVCY